MTTVTDTTQDAALSVGSSKMQIFFVVAGVLAAVYGATATWSLPYHVDALTNALTAWTIADTGSPIVDSHAHAVGDDYFQNINWLVESPRGPVAQYPPGTALLTAPVYLLSTDAEIVHMTGNNRPDVPPIAVPIPAMWPATLMAVMATAAAFGFLAVAFSALVPVRYAVGAALIGGLGTSAWSVASNMSWQHGPAMMWIALGLALVADDRTVGSGLAFAGAVLTRPHTAVVPAAVGIGRWLESRHLGRLVQMAVFSGLGLIALLGFNYWLFDTVTISGGYGSDFTDQLTNRSVSGFLTNVWGGLFDLRRGFLLWSPFLLVLIPGLRGAWKSAPAWVRSSAVGGVVFLLLQYGANRFSGGDGHFTYRYPLEALVAAAPLLVLSARTWTTTRLRSRLLLFAVVGSVVAHAVGAIYT